MRRTGNTFAILLIAVSLGLTACNGGNSGSQSPSNSSDPSNASSPGQQTQGGSAAVQPAPQPAPVGPSLPDGVPPSSPDPDVSSSPSPSLSPVESNSPAEIPNENAVWALAADGTSVEAIQRTKGQLLYSLILRRPATQILKTDTALWIVARDGTFSRFELSTGNLDEVFTVRGVIGPVALSSNHIWVARRTIDSPHGTLRPEVLEFDLVSGARVATIPFGDVADEIGAIQAIGDSIFVLVDNHFGLYRIHVGSSQVSRVNLGLPEGYGRGGLTSVGDTLWVLDTFSSKLVVLNSKTLDIEGSGDVPKNVRPRFAVNGSSVFVIPQHEWSVLKLDPRGALMRELAFEEEPRAIAEVSGQIWVSLPSRIVEIDPRTGSILKSFNHIAVQGFAEVR